MRLSEWLLGHRIRRYFLHFQLLSLFDYQTQPVPATRFRRRLAKRRLPTLPEKQVDLKLAGKDHRIAAGIVRIGRTVHTARGDFLAAAVHKYFDREHSVDRSYTDLATLEDTDVAG